MDAAQIYACTSGIQPRIPSCDIRNKWQYEIEMAQQCKRNGIVRSELSKAQVATFIEWCKRTLLEFPDEETKGS
jgi:hypothetical protein